MTTTIQKVLTILLLAATALAGCAKDDLPFVHRIDIAQGNIVTEDMVSRLEPGMTRRQVRFVMGSPMLVDAFHPDRWYYLYRFEPGGDEPATQRVVLSFEGDRLAGIDAELLPEGPGAVATAPGARTVEVPPGDDDRGLVGTIVDNLKVLTGDELPDPEDVEAEGGPEPPEETAAELREATGEDTPAGLPPPPSAP